MFQPARTHFATPHFATSLFSSPEAEGDAVRRLTEEDPFYRARAERHEKLTVAIRDLEWTLPWDPSRATANCLKSLNKRRDALAGEMAMMVADAARLVEVRIEPPAAAASIATHDALAPLAPRPKRKFDWKWP